MPGKQNQVHYTLIPMSEMGADLDGTTELVFSCSHCILKVKSKELQRHAVNVHNQDRISVDTRELGQPVTNTLLNNPSYQMPDPQFAEITVTIKEGDKVTTYEFPRTKNSQWETDHDPFTRQMKARLTLEPEPFNHSGEAVVVHDGYGNPHDEYHTMDELYDYRMLYNAHAVRGWVKEGFDVVKSWKHFDGEECFGGGWFIVTVQLPTGQVSNHYKEEYWTLFDCLTVEKAPEWDGHTPEIASNRLYNYLTGTENQFPPGLG